MILFSYLFHIIIQWLSASWIWLIPGQSHIIFSDLTCMDIGGWQGNFNVSYGKAEKALVIVWQENKILLQWTLFSHYKSRLFDIKKETNTLGKLELTLQVILGYFYGPALVVWNHCSDKQGSVTPRRSLGRNTDPRTAQLQTFYSTNNGVLIFFLFFSKDIRGNGEDVDNVHSVIPAE